MLLFQQCVIIKWLEQTIQRIRLVHFCGCHWVWLRGVLCGIGLFYAGWAMAQTPSLSITEVVLSKTDQINLLLQQAQQAQQVGQMSQASQAYQKLLQVMPEHANARFELATLWVAQGHWLQAAKLLQAGLNLDPHQTKLTVALVQLYRQMGQDQAAFQSVKMMPDSDANRVWRLEQQAILAQRLQQHQVAQISYAALVEHQPAQGRWWLGLAIAQDRLQHPILAIAAYQRALTIQHWSLSSRQFIQKRLQVLQEEPTWHD